MSDGLDDDAVTLSATAAVSVSPTVKASADEAVSSRSTRFVGDEMVGAAFTVTVNVRVKMLLTAPASLTLTVMVAVPATPGFGVSVSEPVADGLV